MRLRTDCITEALIHEAAREAHVGFERLTEHRATSRRGPAWDVLLTGSSPRRPNSGHRGANGDEYAASWDEWGLFLGYLYAEDPGMTCGSRVYLDAQHFHWVTDGRFNGGILWSEQHRNHKFRPHGSQWVTDGLSYYESGCDCGAIQRWLGQDKWVDVRDRILGVAV